VDSNREPGAIMNTVFDKAHEYLRSVGGSWRIVQNPGSTYSQARVCACGEIAEDYNFCFAVAKLRYVIAQKEKLQEDSPGAFDCNLF
jgi:hypothetical protein